MNQQELDIALNKAKVALMSKADSAFYTTVLFSLKFQWDDAQPTAYTDGYIIGFNRQFFESLRPGERVGILIHEAMHVAYMHPLRKRAGMCHDMWNAAADHVINLQLLKVGFELPSWVLADQRFAGLSTEQVYGILEKEGGKPQPNPMQDLRQPGQGEDDAGEQAFQQHVQEILVRATVQAKMAGNSPGSVPGDIQLYLDSLLNPKLPWQTILRRFLNATAKSDYSWKRPNRRFMPEHYLPSLYSESMIDLAVWADISCSVSDSDFKRIVSETAGIFKMMKPKTLTFGQFDTRIQSIDKIKSMHDMANLTFTGRGGTRIDEVMAWLNKNQPELAIIFTDGDFNKVAHHLTAKTKVIWMIHDNNNWKPPFPSKVICYDINSK